MGLGGFSVALALAVLAAIVGRFHDRLAGERPKGIGWQFIRSTVLTISLPIIGLLALNVALTGEAATLIAGAMGYTFAKREKKNE